MKRWQAGIPGVVAVLLAGCAGDGATANAGGASAGGVPLVQGEARVVSVNRTLGQAVLEVEGKQIVGYWQLETAKAQGGDVVAGGVLKPDVAAYREPVVSAQAFPAEAGDRVAFVAMRTGQTYWLRGVRVVSR